MYRLATPTVLAVLAATLLGVETADAQVVERGNFDIGVGGGAMLHPNHSALVGSSPFVNLRGRIFITQNVGLGFSVDYARTETDDDIFPLAQFRFRSPGDSTLFVALRQPLSLLHYQLTGTVGAPVGESLYPYLTVGIGGYTIYLDPQTNNASERQSDLAFSFGGAVKLRVSGSAAIELSVRDVVYTGFDRDKLNPTFNRTCRAGTERQYSGNVCPNERFPLLDPEFADPNWEEGKSSVHNILIMAAFTFVPRI